MTADTPDSLTPELLVRAYCMGVFPMAEGRDGAIHWLSPDPRAVIPLEDGGFKVSRSLHRRVNQGAYRITKDEAFNSVIRACAEPRPAEDDTWINDELVDVYCQLHEAGLAHSVEAWSDDDPSHPVGGLYGVALGGAFFGESMFHRATDASKVCLVSLVDHLRARGFTLLDVQFVNPHLKQFGVTEITRTEYLERLEDALRLDVTW